MLDSLWTETSGMPALRRLVPYEHADLRLGDIPLFTTRPGQRHLWSSTGECIPGYFARDSLGEVRERLAAMDERDCAWQASRIRQSRVSLDGVAPPWSARRDSTQGRLATPRPPPGVQLT